MNASTITFRAVVADHGFTHFRTLFVSVLDDGQADLVAHAMIPCLAGDVQVVSLDPVAY